MAKSKRQQSTNKIEGPDETLSEAPLPDHITSKKQKGNELPKRPPHFRITGQNKQRHGRPLYSLAWCSDVHRGKSKTEYQYVAMCGHNEVLVYEVQVDTPRGVFQLKQSYKDEDKQEQFYALEFAGRSSLLANSKIRTNDGTAASYAANDEDTASSCSEDDSDNDSSKSDTGDSSTKFNSSTLLLEKEHCVDINHISFPCDSSTLGPQLLCAGGCSGVIKVIDPVKMKQIASLHGHGDEVYDLKVSPTNENLLLSASIDESIRLWNLGAFACVAIFAGQHGHEGFVLSLSWHFQGERFASSGKDQSIRLWSINDGKVQEALGASRRLNRSQRRPSFHPASQPLPYFATSKVHRNVVDCVHFLGDDMILSKSTYNSIILWAPILPEGTAPSCASGEAAFKPPSDILVLRTFDLRDCNLWFVRFAVDPIGRLLAVGTIKGEVDVWDIDSCEERPSQRLKAITNQTIRTLAFSPNGKILVTCCDNAQVCKWNEWDS
jgi:WD40 repeat protein